MKRMNTSVLVVEPRLVHSLWIKPVLEIAGVQHYEIEPDPLFALDAYLSGEFDLVLAAWPFKIEGCEWITAAKSMLRETDPPVIAMLSHSGHLERRTALTHKADDIIMKPFTRRALIAVLRKHLVPALGEANVIDLDQYRCLKNAH